MSKCLSVKYVLISKKKLGPYFEPIKKLFFRGVHFEGVRGGNTPNDVKIFVS